MVAFDSLGTIFVFAFHNNCGRNFRRFGTIHKRDREFQTTCYRKIVLSWQPQIVENEKLPDDKRFLVYFANGKINKDFH